jgi:hypothetical protein
MELLLIVFGIMLLAAFAALANEIGVDSRELSDEPGHPAHPVGIA